MKWEINTKTVFGAVGGVAGLALIINGSMNVRQRLDEGYDAIAAWPQGLIIDNFTDVKDLVTDIGDDDSGQPESGLGLISSSRAYHIGNSVINLSQEG